MLIIITSKLNLMPAIYHNYPSSFEVLRPVVRGKALEMANILISAGYNYQMAQTIAISNARQLAFNKDGLLGIENKHLHLIPNPNGWALASESLLTIFFICDTKNEALMKGTTFAKNEKLKLFIHSDEGDIIDSESFAVNMPVSATGSNNDALAPDGAVKEIMLVDSKREVYNKTNFLAKRRHSQLINEYNNS
jgi:hypothetical protein